MPETSTRPDRASLAPLLLGALLLGVGQQLFVALRNPYLADLGVPAHVVPYVQGTGTAAGVLGAWLAARAGRWTRRGSFLASACLQATGFALQLVGRGVAVIFVGAAIAGVGIQLHLALAPAALREVEPARRVRAFALWSAITTPGAGMLAAVFVQPLTLAFGRTIAAERLALGSGAIVSLGAWFAFRRLRAATAATQAPSLTARNVGRVRALVAFQALTGFAGGLAVPLLHLHFRLAFGVPLDGIALLHGATMLIGLGAAAIAPLGVRRLGHVRALVVLYALTAPLFLELAATHDVRLAIALFIGRHALVHLTTPIAQALFQELVPAEDAAAVAAYGVMASAAAWATASFVAGPLVAAGGESLTGPMVGSAIGFALAALVASLSFPAMWRARSPE